MSDTHWFCLHFFQGKKIITCIYDVYARRGVPPLELQVNTGGPHPKNIFTRIAYNKHYVDFELRI